MWTDDETVAAGHSIDPAVGGCLPILMGRIAGRLGEWVGEATPHGMQHLLCRASWDADAVRDDVRDYVVEHSTTTRRCWWSTRPAT